MRRFIFEEPESSLAVWSRRIAVFALAVMVIAILLLRGGAQNLTGAAALGSGIALAILAMLVTLAAFIRIWMMGYSGIGKAVQALIIAATLLGPPVGFGVLATMLPRINDISTDLDEPPDFSRSRAALAARNGRVIGQSSAETRAKQRDVYVKVQPILLEQSAEEAFELARKVSGMMGWKIIESIAPSARGGSGRIDATATTTILRFTDDITIRIRARAQGSRIDLRSASRIGSHDFGANATRIVKFAAALDEELNNR
jgi:uncharacterized protein (DUF1499 family)